MRGSYRRRRYHYDCLPFPLHLRSARLLQIPGTDLHSFSSVALPSREQVAAWLVLSLASEYAGEPEGLVALGSDACRCVSTRCRRRGSMRVVAVLARAGRKAVARARIRGNGHGAPASCHSRRTRAADFPRVGLRVRVHRNLTFVEVGLWRKIVGPSIITLRCSL